MKRLLLGWILVGSGTFAACASEAPAPVDNLTGGTGATGQGGSTAANGGTGMVSGTGNTTTTGGSGGTGNTTTTGGSGGTGNTTTTGGSAGMATGGTAGSTSGSAGMPGGGNGGSSGAGTMMGGTAGMGGSAGMPAGGMGGSAGTPAGGGMGGSAGTPAGGMSGAGTGGMGEEDLTAVAAPLDGQTILMPCDNDTSVRVCTPRADTSKPCTGTGPSYAGTHSFNEQVTLGGEAGVRYLVTLRIRGMTEGKTYTGGMDRSNSGTQVPADGLYIGGQADNSGNGYNIYFIRTDSPSQYYYLNSIAAGNDTRIRHSVFESDFEVEMPVDGGSKVCLVSADPNTSAIKNCQDPEGDLSMCNPMTVPNLDAATTADIKSQPYNGQFVGISVKSVKRM